MAVALVDQHTVSGEAVLAHTVVYGGLGVLVLGLDLAFLSALSSVLGDSLAQRDVVLVVLVCSAVFYGPLRAGLWRVARRWLLGQRDDPYDVVAGLAAGLERAEEGPEQLSAVARAVAQAFGVSFVAVEVDRAAGARLAATLGTRPRETRALPISYRGTTVGRLVLPARGLRTQLDRRDERLLGDLVRQAAAAARTSQLADELQSNREELVLAREEERRRIRRDLHDGLGPSLGGAVFLLDSARLLVDRDPDAAEAQLDATESHLRGVMDDVRRLVSDLRPPALDALGLVGALRQQGELVPGVEVHLEAADPAPLAALPAAVEVAAYRIVGEALTNVARHAAATRCAIRLEVATDAAGVAALLVEVADDGLGIPLERQAGVGLLSLRERADELGGRTEITCPAEGGTVVRAWLPIPALTAAPTTATAAPPLEELVS
nr:histidine kinase [Nocardioides flavescens]